MYGQIDIQQFLKVFLVTVLSFGISIFTGDNEFIRDDARAIDFNKDVSNLNQSIIKNIVGIFTHDFYGENLTDEYSSKAYRPFISLSYHLELRYFGRENLPAVLKRINLLFHAITCTVFYDCLVWMFYGFHPRLVLGAVLLYAAHPIHTEVICSVTGRADIFCALLFVITIGSFMNLIGEHELTGKIVWHRLVSVFIGALLCLLCKEVGIMALPFCIAFDMLAHFNLPTIEEIDLGRRLGNVFKRTLWMIILITILVVFRGSMTSFTFPKFEPQENPIAVHPDIFVRILTSCYVHALNMWLLICPVWMCHDWSHNSIKLIESFSDHRLIFPTMLYSLLLYKLFHGPRYNRFAIALLVVPFIPASNLLPNINLGYVLDDRSLYIPSIGYCILATTGIYTFYLRAPKISAILYFTLLFLFIIRSNQRSFDMQNNLKLYTSGIRVCPNNAKIYYDLGEIHASKGNYNQSLKYTLIAYKLNSNDLQTLINLGIAYRNVGNAQAAIDHHEEVTAIDQNDPWGWMHLGLSYIENGMYEKALNAYRQANKLKPNDGLITYNYGKLYFQMRKFELADEMFRVAENSNDDVPILMSIAKMYPKMKVSFARIEKVYLRILEIEPRNFIAHARLSYAHYKRNKPRLALYHYRKAREINPNFEINDPNYNDYLELHHRISKI